MPQNRIHKRADGRYTYAATDRTGRRQSLASRKGETLRAFSKRCDVLDSTLQGAPGSSRMTFDELFEMWATEYLPTRSRAHSEAMRAHYAHHIRPRFGRARVAEMTTYDIYTFLQSKVREGYSRSLIGKLRQAISGPFTWAIKSGLLTHNPCDGVRLNYTAANDRTSPNVALSDDQLAEFFAVADRTRYGGYFRLMLLTGLRPSEALGLRRSDIRGGLIHVAGGITMRDDSRGKTANAIRTIPVTDDIRAVIDASPHPEWLFAARKPTMDMAKSAFARIRRQIGFDVTMYSFRTTFATRCARAGMAPKTLQHIMGHSDIKTTLSYYVRIEKQDMDAAAEVMKKIVCKIECKAEAPKK